MRLLILLLTSLFILIFIFGLSYELLMFIQKEKHKITVCTENVCKDYYVRISKGEHIVKVKY